MSAWMVFCVCEFECMRASIPICLQAWMNACECFICVCVCVWIYVRMKVYVYTIHIYAFRLYSGTVFHGYGTFILRSTYGYLAFCGIKWDINCTLCFQHLVLNRVSWCNLNRQQCTSHRCCLPSLTHTRRRCHISQSASSHDTVNVIYKWWCWNVIQRYLRTWQRSHRGDLCVISGRNTLLPSLKKLFCTCRFACRLFQRCCWCEDVR